MRKIALLIAGLFVMELSTVVAQDTTRTVVTTTTVTTPTASPAPIAVKSEEPSQTGLHLGLRFQPTFVALTNRGYEQDARRISATIGYGYGGSLAYFFNNYVSFNLEVVYSEIDQDYMDEQNNERRLGVSYFDIPMLATINSNFGRQVNINAALGPQLGIFSGARFDGKSQGETSNVDAVVALDPVGIGLGYGAGIDFGMGAKRHTHLNLGFRGVAGLTNTAGMYIGLMFKL
jgi:hypothetical protein